MSTHWKGMVTLHVHPPQSQGPSCNTHSQLWLSHKVVGWEGDIKLDEQVALLKWTSILRHSLFQNSPYHACNTHHAHTRVRKKHLYSQKVLWQPHSPASFLINCWCNHHVALHQLAEWTKSKHWICFSNQLSVICFIWLQLVSCCATVTTLLP